MVAFLACIALAHPPGFSLRPAQWPTTISLRDSARQACPLVMRNGTFKSIEIWQAGFWPNHRMTMRDSAGKLVTLNRLGELGAARFGSAARDKNAPFTIAPGASFWYLTPPLPKAFRLHKGDYSLTVIYDERVMGKRVSVASRPIHIHVVD